MRITIEIDDRLLGQAMAASGAATTEAVVAEALQSLLAERRRRAIANLAGIGWDGDLDAMRCGRDT